MMNTRFRRRIFLGALAGSGLLAAGIGVSLWPLSPQLRLRNLIRSRLDYLKITDDVLDAFVKDYMSDPRAALAYLGTTDYVLRRTAYGSKLFADRLPLFRVERQIISKFLMSTDFFREGADVSRPVKYVAYNDPYKLGCANYFARL